MSEIAVRQIVHPRFGRVYCLNARTVLAAPLERVFEFFSNAENLERLTPRWIGFRILTPLPIEMRQGALIDYRILLHGIPVKWRTKIEVWDPLRCFVDVQLRGPYKLWHHTHSFCELDGGTEMRDEVLYWPKGGALANRLLVERDVRRIFAYRAEEIQKVFGARSG